MSAVTGVPPSAAHTAGVGDELPPMHLPPVSRSMLALFAEASGDHNPIHIDMDFARQCGMPDVFAQGMLIMAWMARLLTNWSPQAKLRCLEVRFVGVTHLDDAISCSGKVINRTTKDDHPCLIVELAAKNQYGDVKLTGTAIVSMSL